MGASGLAVSGAQGFVLVCPGEIVNVMCMRDACVSAASAVNFKLETHVGGTRA